MNGGGLPHIGGTPMGQVFSGQPVSSAASEVQPIAALPAFASVQTLLAGLEQVEGEVNPCCADAMLDLAEHPITESAESTEVLPGVSAMPAMQLGLPQAMHEKKAQFIGSAAVVPMHASVVNALEVQEALAPYLQTVRSDTALPVAANGQAMNSDEVLVSPTLSMTAAVPSPTASVRMPGLSAASSENVSAQAVSVQQGPQALVQALAQRLQVQQMQGHQVAVVRLDPPHMGVIELRISHDAAGVQVHMQASNSEVGRQLVTVTDPLRQELLARSADAQITVSTSRSFGSGGQSDPQRQAWMQDEDFEIGQALQDAEHPHTAHT